MFPEKIIVKHPTNNTPLKFKWYFTNVNNLECLINFHLINLVARKIINIIHFK